MRQIRSRMSWSTSPAGNGRFVAMATTQHVQLKGAVEGRASEVLTPKALEFVARLRRQFGARRQELPRLRDERQTRIEAAEVPQFLGTTGSVRHSAGADG